ncbi:hypothetical protein O6R05_01250 [Peptoniphilus equinus]|uniref:Integrase catalytic domain-containing protein n=1 Tax=Peptoniphilus equinus TaxID=3016343 RepID=A0ABY7QTW9_9FIRM|nr:IS3 family transposase [Peptoniphilus equinus]WBW50214.1 hypothetical protein O6R05_01250 [Peptoniphilus equinus]
MKLLCHDETRNSPSQIDDSYEKLETTVTDYIRSYHKERSKKPLDRLSPVVHHQP